MSVPQRRNIVGPGDSDQFGDDSPQLWHGHIKVGFGQKADARQVIEDPIAFLHVPATLRRAVSISALCVLAGCAVDKPTGTASLSQETAAKRPEVSLASSGGAGTDAVRDALLRLPAIEEAANEIAASVAEVRVSRSDLFPQLGLGATTGVTTNDGGNDPALELTRSQVITDFGATAQAIDAADLEVLRNYVAFQQAVDNAAVETLTLMADVQRARVLVPLRTK